MHDESGLKNSEQEDFWRDVFQMMKQVAPNLRLDLRAKGLPDSVIQSASEMGVPFRITTKYWMEQMGLPFHPTHINKQNQFDRRHSYADMLRYPATLQDALAPLERRDCARALVGRSGLCAALCRK